MLLLHKLLVVLVVIRILALIGMDAYNVYTGALKKKAINHYHRQMKIWVQEKFI